MKRIRVIHFFAPLIYVVIAYLSLSPNEYNTPVDLGFFPVDKLVHFVMYFTLAMASLIQMSRLGKIKSPKSVLLWACMMPVLFGGLIELIQAYFTTDRSGDWLDFTANCTGVVISYLLFKILLARLSWISPDRLPLPDRGHESR